MLHNYMFSTALYPASHGP